MPKIHPAKQRRFIEKAGVGELCRWFRGRAGDNYDPSTNSRTESDGLVLAYPDQQSSFHYHGGWLYEEQSLEPPDSALTGTPTSGGGFSALSNGTYAYACTFMTRYGETTLGPSANVVVSNAPAQGAVHLTDLPAVPSPLCTGRAIYRAHVGADSVVGEFRLMVVITDNSATQYVDNRFDSHLAWNPPKRNTTYPKVLIQGFKTTMEDVGGDNMPSLFKVGNAKVSFMPSDCPLERPDKLILTSEARRLTGRETRTRGEGDTDVLDNFPVMEIVRVLQRDAREADYVPFVDFIVAPNGSGIKWIGDAPAAGEIYSVEYTYQPTVWFLGSDVSQAHPSFTGEGLARNGRVVWRHPDRLKVAA